MTNGLMDTLQPAEPPTAKGARALHPLDGDRVDVADNSKREPSIDYKAMALKNRAAAVRYALFDNPDGLGYDELSKGTGIARDRIAAHIGNLLVAGDIKAYEFPGRGRVFKITSQGADRVGERAADQVPAKSTAVAREQSAPSRDATARAAPSNVADRKPADESLAPATDRASESAATRQAVAAQASATVRTDAHPPRAGGPVSAIDHSNEAPQAEEAARPSAGSFPLPGRSAANPACASASDSALAIAIELLALSAHDCIGAMRDAAVDREKLTRAIANFEAADRLYVSAKGRA